MGGGQTEEGLECRHWRAAAIKSEGELVEVRLQVPGADAVMSAPEPSLEVPEDAVHSREDLGRAFGVALSRGAMPIAHSPERTVGSPPIGQADRPAVDVRRHKTGKGGCRRVRDHLETYAARGLPPD